MVSGKIRRQQLWALIAILLLAFGLRLARLGAESLWYDETVSVHLAGERLPDLVAHTAGDIHPPGYYILLHAWTGLAGHSDFAAAFLSLFFGVLLVALAYWLAARLFGWEAGLLAAFLVAISPYNLWYSQEVRMYTLGAVLGMGVLGAALSLLDLTRPYIWWLGIYIICAAAGLWALYYFAFLLVAVNLMAGGWWLFQARRGSVGGRWLGRWLLAQGAVLLLYAPWLPVAWRQVAQPPVPPWRSFTGLGDLLVQTWSALSLGQSVEPAKIWPVLALVAILFGLGLWRGSRSYSWFLAGYTFLPVLLIYLASFVTPLFHVRYVFTYSTPFYILVGVGLVAAGRRWKPALWLGLAAIVAFSGVSIYAYHTDARYAGDDHRAAAQFLAARWRPGDAILVNAGYAYTALLTYWDGDPIVWRGRLVRPAAAIPAGPGPVVVQTGTVGGDPGLGWGDPASDFYAMTQADAEGALADLFGQFDRVWVYRVYDTVTDPDGVLRDWLAAHGAPFEDQVFGGESQLRVQGFLTGRDPLADPGLVHLAGAALADGSLQLVATAFDQEVAVGRSLDVALIWRVGSPPAGDAILFAGLFDEQGRRWAQADERPIGSLYPPSAWPAGGLVRTPLRVPVPPGTPPGPYRLEVGWYRFVDGQPRWLPWTAGDRLALGEVAVVAPDDWSALPLPPVAYPAGVTVGRGLRFLGFAAPSLAGRPGEELPVDLFWQALGDAPETGLDLLQLSDRSGRVVAEALGTGGTSWAAGQAIREMRRLELPGGLAPGVYNLAVGRRRADGTWLPIRRGPFALGTTYPLATVRVLGRPVSLIAPAVQYATDAWFGTAIRLAGYDLLAYAATGSTNPELMLHWQSLAPTVTRYKIFVHLVDPGQPAGIRAQADLYPSLPTTSWAPGEYVSERVTLTLPPGLAPGRYDLIVGLYDEVSGGRLPVFDAAGQPLGDSLLLQEISIGQ